MEVEYTESLPPCKRKQSMTSGAASEFASASTGKDFAGENFEDPSKKNILLRAVLTAAAIGLVLVALSFSLFVVVMRAVETPSTDDTDTTENVPIMHPVGRLVVPSMSATTARSPSILSSRPVIIRTAGTKPHTPPVPTIVPVRTTIRPIIKPPSPPSPRVPLPLQPPMKRFPMVCVFGTATNESVVMPADGVCDFTFYDGFYTHPDDTLTGLDFRPAVKHVLGNAMKHTATKYGLSFDYRKRHEVGRAMLRSAVQSRIMNLWQQNIRHYGFLSMNSIEFTAPDFREVIEVLAFLDNLLQKQRTSPQDASYSAIGFYAEGVDLDEAVITIRTVYTPSLIIAHGHIGFDDRGFGTDCKMVLPTPLNAVGKYRSSQRNALEMLEKLKHHTAALAVSVALFGRRYKPANPNPVSSPSIDGFLPGQACTSYAGDYLVHFTHFCIERIFLRNLKKDIYDKGVSSFDKDGQWTIVYDTEQSLAEKLCLGKQAHINLPYGVAAYGLEYSDYSNECPSMSTSGAYGRARLLKEMVDLFKTGPGAGKMRDCVTEMTKPRQRGDAPPE